MTVLDTRSIDDILRISGRSSRYQLLRRRVKVNGALAKGRLTTTINSACNMYCPSAQATPAALTRALFLTGLPSDLDLEQQSSFATRIDRFGFSKSGLFFYGVKA